MNIPSYIKKVIDVLHNNKYECYLVGGCVRDSLMGKTPQDYDLTTNALPDEIIDCFKDMRIIETGLKHGTVTVVSDGENVEITTYRIDGEYIDNRRPESVCFTGLIAEDLSRRDFTVNAIAYSPYDGYVDLFNGMSDINNKVIRSVGDPDKRFNEDGLRIMRALRFSSVLSFDIDKDTVTSIHKNKHLLKNISRERIYSEFKKMLCGDNASRILCDYFDVLCVVFSDLDLYEKHFFDNVFHILNSEKDFIVRIAILFNNFELNFVKSLIRSLKPDKKTYNNIIALCEYVSNDISNDEISIKRMMNRFNHELILKIVSVKKVLKADFDEITFLSVYNTLLNQGVCVSIKQLDINGSDLKECGVSNGPDIGHILCILLDAVIEGRCNNKKTDLMEYLKIKQYIH